MRTESGEEYGEKLKCRLWDERGALPREARIISSIRDANETAMLAVLEKEAP